MTFHSIGTLIFRSDFYIEYLNNYHSMQETQMKLTPNIRKYFRVWSLIEKKPKGKCDAEKSFQISIRFLAEYNI